MPIDALCRIRFCCICKTLDTFETLSGMCWKKTSGCIPQKESLSPPMCLFFRGAEFLGDGISGDSAGREPVASPYPTASQVPIARHNGSSSWCADGWQKRVPAVRPKGKAAPARTFLIRTTKASADERMYNTSKELEDLFKQSDNNRPLQS